jgi:TetR/AcrR family transcriptional regulator, cholesterol catabolism regulator
MQDRIIEGSVDLFDKKGFNRTSIQDIVDSIGVSKGTFYYYFNSKQELLRDIHLNYIRNLLRNQMVYIDDSTLSNIEKLRKMIYLIISNIKSSGKSARVFHREMRHLEEEHIKQVNAIRREFRNNFQRIIEEGMNSGEFRSDLRSDMVTFGILGMANRTYTWYDPDGEVTEEELVDVYMDILVNGLKG